MSAVHIKTKPKRNEVFSFNIHGRQKPYFILHFQLHAITHLPDYGEWYLSNWNGPKSVNQIFLSLLYILWNKRLRH